MVAKYKTKTAKQQTKQKTKQTRKAQRTKAQRTKAQAKTYKILDNGYVPYVVEITPTTLCVIQQNAKERGQPKQNTEIYRTPYKQVFLGEKTGRLTDAMYRKGSSILACIKENHYVYIGSEIYSFYTKEPIIAYESPVGSSSVPYPYAVGEEYTYFMLDKEKVPNELLDHTKDAYGQFYGYTVSKKEEAAIEKKKTAFAFKTIYKS
jgi:hypothetical protein